MGYMSAPAAPDPNVTAAAQTGTNVSTAVANQVLGNVNQVTPYGSLTYNQTGSTSWTDPTSGETYNLPTYTATQSLNQRGQAINNASMGAQRQLAEMGLEQSKKLRNLLSEPMDTSGITRGSGPTNLINNVGKAGDISTIGSGPKLATTYGTDFSADRRRVENTLMRRMQPGLDQDKAALEQRLADQGIQYGSPAYEAAMSDMGRQTNDARMSAILAGGEEQSRMVGMERDRAMFGNDARNDMFANRATATGLNNAAQAQQFGQNVTSANFTNQSRLQEAQQRDAVRGREMQERFALRNQPLNEISSLMSGSQLQSPNFLSGLGTSMPTTDYAGIVNSNYANQMQGYSANQAMLGGLLGAGANMLMLSDRRAKKDIRKVGKLDDGQNVYAYRYKSGGPTQIGLMAQEVQKRRPDAVAKLEGGLMAVDYAKATEARK